MFESVRVSGRGQADALVAGVMQDASGACALDEATKALDAGGVIAAACARSECTGEPGRISEAHPGGGDPARRVLLVGLGKKENFSAGSLRAIAAAVGRRLAVTRDENVAVELSGPLEAAGVDAGRAGRAFGEGAALLGFDFDAFKGKASEDRPKRSKLSLRSSEKAFQDGMKRGAAVAESANLARGWAATPPNVATPMWMAKQAQAIARGVETLSVRIIKGDELERETLTGIATVGQASENEPCLIRIAYTPKPAKRGAKPAVLIGKTITYDTGGLSIKPTSGMRGMKQDKDGGCAALGAMHAIATVIKPKRPVVCLLAAAENSISDEAYRPDDVLTFRNGVTVEVTNTDAEGRLVMADALCWAADKEKPAFMIDLATLTGGVVTALGSTYAGMWCEDDGLRSRIESAAEESGERVWRLPLHQEYRDMMRSDVADIINSSPQRKAHPIQAAAFLSYFARNDTPWCHLDIAGVHSVDGDVGPFVKNSPTGWGVRLLASLFEQE